MPSWPIFCQSSQLKFSNWAQWTQGNAQRTLCNNLYVGMHNDRIILLRKCRQSQWVGNHTAVWGTKHNWKNRYKYTESNYMNWNVARTLNLKPDNPSEKGNDISNSQWSTAGWKILIKTPFSTKTPFSLFQVWISVQRLLWKMALSVLLLWLC